jgi:protein transport protein YIF1
VKRVSDVNAMGVSSPSPQPFNPEMQPSPQYYSPNPQMNYGVQQPQQPMEGNFMNNQYASPVAPNPYEMPMHSAASASAATSPMPNLNQMGGFAPQLSMLQQPMVQDMAFQYGQKLADQGKELMNKELEKYVSVTKLKYYFAVDNRYVMNKLRLIFFPFTHRDWSLKYDQGEQPAQPRYDINAPDLYIPVMGYITFIVLAGFILGMQERFTPEQLGIQASSALAYNLFELIIYTITLYVTNIQTSLRTLDLVAYSGYKYASIVAVLCGCVTFTSGLYWILLLYTGLALSFFLVNLITIS